MIPGRGNWAPRCDGTWAADGGTVATGGGTVAAGDGTVAAGGSTVAAGGDTPATGDVALLMGNGARSPGGRGTSRDGGWGPCDGVPRDEISRDGPGSCDFAGFAGFAGFADFAGFAGFGGFAGFAGFAGFGGFGGFADFPGFAGFAEGSDGAETSGDCTDPPRDGALGEDAVTPDGDGGSLVLEDDAGGPLVSWALRPPVPLRSEPDRGGSRSNNSRNSRRKLPGSLICRSCSKFAQMWRWICSRGSNRSYAWNTLLSSDHIVPSEKLGFTTSNSDLSTVMRSAA